MVDALRAGGAFVVAPEGAFVSFAPAEDTAPPTTSRLTMTIRIFFTSNS